jgi:dihydroorotase
VKELLSLWGGEGENGELRGRCCGVKVFFDHSTGNQKADVHLIEEVFRVCAEKEIPVVAHCEDTGINTRASRRKGEEAALHSLMRPPESEEKAVASAIGLTSRFGTALHIAHLSTKQGLHLVRQAKQSGLPVTCQVTPHHLFLSVEDYATLGALGKMNPPLRSRDHCEALWGGILEGVVDVVASDHAPHTLGEKQSVPPLKAPSGVPGVETMVPLLLTVAAGKWPHPHTAPLCTRLLYADIRRLCYENPNKIFSLGKGAFTIGSPADFVLVKPEEEWVISKANLHAKCGWTPYEGWRVMGKITAIGRW